MYFFGGFSVCVQTFEQFFFLFLLFGGASTTFVPTEAGVLGWGGIEAPAASL